MRVGRRYAAMITVVLGGAFVVACSDDTSDESEPAATSGSTEAPDVTDAATVGDDAASTTTADDGGSTTTPDVHGATVEPEFSDLFSVEYHDGYKVVRASANLAFDESEAADTYVLVQRGAEPPELSGDLADALVITVPVTNVASANGEEVAFLNEVGRTDVIKAIFNQAYSRTAEMDARYRDGSLEEFGIFGFDPAPEELVAMEPDLVIRYTGGREQREQVLADRELGLPTVAGYQASEPNALARAEWVKFYALFVNEEAAANAVFDEIVANYEAVASRAADVEQRPSVWINGEAYTDAMITDAGGTNASPVSPDSAPEIGSEEYTQALLETDVWMVISDSDLSTLAAENPTVPYEEFPAVRNDRAWSWERESTDWAYNPGVNWYGPAVARPDLVLADMFHAFHPELASDYEPVFAQPLTES